MHFSRQPRYPNVNVSLDGSGAFFSLNNNHGIQRLCFWAVVAVHEIGVLIFVGYFPTMWEIAQPQLSRAISPTRLCKC
jgi:hypothetical protein